MQYLVEMDALGQRLLRFFFEARVLNLIIVLCVDCKSIKSPVNKQCLPNYIDDSVYRPLFCWRVFEYTFHLFVYMFTSTYYVSSMFSLKNRPTLNKYEIVPL